MSENDYQPVATIQGVVLGACPTCGAAVADYYRDIHDAWHEREEER